VKNKKNMEKVRTLVRDDHHVSMRMVAESLNMGKETVRQIITENLNMSKVCAKMVLKNLKEEQKLRRK
jgi:hypothetical protein